MDQARRTTHIRAGCPGLTLDGSNLATASETVSIRDKVVCDLLLQNWIIVSDFHHSRQIIFARDARMDQPRILLPHQLLHPTSPTIPATRIDCTPEADRFQTSTSGGLSTRSWQDPSTRMTHVSHEPLFAQDDSFTGRNCYSTRLGAAPTTTERNSPRSNPRTAKCLYATYVLLQTMASGGGNLRPSRLPIFLRRSPRLHACGARLEGCVASRKWGVLL